MQLSSVSPLNWGIVNTLSCPLLSSVSLAILRERGGGEEEGDIEREAETHTNTLKTY